MRQKKPFYFYLLLFLLFFEGITGFAGGLIFLIDPEGKIMQLPPDALKNSPFSNYIFPGILLFTFIGVYPLIVAYGLLKHPDWEFANKLNIYKNEMHWAWTHAVYAAITLLVFISVETILVGYNWLQSFYTFLAICILIFTLLPTLKKLYVYQNMA